MAYNMVERKTPMKRGTKIIIALITLFTTTIASYVMIPKAQVNASTCMTIDEVINSRGWENIEDVEDGGRRVNLPDDSDLPVGFEAIADDAHITIRDPERFMHAGIWSIYRVCSGVVEPPDETCPNINELIEHSGWLGIGQVDNSGVLVQTFLDDSLPFGYEAIGENSHITLDDPDRFMPAGFWSLYQLCPFDP